jgi:L-threonylcarbamoyladenylate synthase
MTAAEHAALMRAGALAILPTDTVYGVACAAGLPAAVQRLYALKLRPSSQATAVMLGSVERLIADAIPETGAPIARLLARVLPGPVTLVIPNPGRRFAHVCGDDPDRIGVRVPDLTDEIAALADAVGGLVITSANLRGQAAPATFAAVPQQLLAAASIAIDGGRLPGTSSAVIDVTGPRPVVLRDGPGLDSVLAAVR